ncbi:MAG: hypothetical protein QM757_09240 [Paludibaculum sp.]
MFLLSAGSGGVMAPVFIGAGLIYAGVWTVLRPSGFWKLVEGLMDGIQRFESSLHLAPWWSGQSRRTSELPPSHTAIRVAGAVLAILGVLSLAGGLSQWT